jgi:zinc transport system substrate-binding protein
MKKIFVLLTILAFLSTFITVVNAEEEKINIVCTNSALADFTSNIIMENVTISYIMPGGACPAHFDTTPSDIEKCINADIIISLGWEPWLEGLISSSGNTDAKQIKCTGLGEWSLPSVAVKFVEKIRNDLVDIYPDLIDEIQQDAEIYILEINQTSILLQNMIKTAGYNDREVICMAWQKEFVEFLGLDVVEFYDPPESLSTQDQLNIAEAATKSGVCAIIDNLQSGTEFGETIAGQSGISHIVFTNFPGAITGVDSYLDVMSYNTGELLKGITIYDYKQENIKGLTSDASNVELQRNTAFVIAIIVIILAFVLFIMYKKK